MKKQMLALLCACLLTFCLPAQAVSNKAAATFTESDGSYTLQCPKGWAAYNWADSAAHMGAQQDEPFGTLFSYFMYYQGLMDSPTYLFKNGAPAVISLMLTNYGQRMSDAELAADSARTLGLFRVYEALTPTQPEAAPPAQAQNGVRWLEYGFTFVHSGTQWEAVCLLGVKGKLLIRLNMLTPKATAQEDRQALHTVQETFALTPGREDAGITFQTLYGQFRIDDDKVACYQNGHNGYVDVGERLVYAVPLDWIALFESNLNDELAAITDRGTPQAKAFATVVNSLYSQYSATLLTPDRQGVLVSAYNDLDPMKSWNLEARKLVGDVRESLLSIPGFVRMVAAPDLSSAETPDTLVFEYIVHLEGYDWQALLGYIPYGAYLPCISLCVPEGGMSDALRAEFANTLRSVQAGIPVEP